MLHPAFTSTFRSGDSHNLAWRLATSANIQRNFLIIRQKLWNGLALYIYRACFPETHLFARFWTLCTQYELRVYTCPFFGSPRGFPQVSPHGTMSSCIT